MCASPACPSTLIVTLGAKPQLATLAMDCLKEMGAVPERLLCIHASRQRGETDRALIQIQTDLRVNYPKTAFYNLELAENGHPLPDITSPEQVQVAFRVLYAEVRAAKLSETIVHLLIAGGRRTLTVFGMAVAQMLFDDEDHLWHLASHPALEDAGRLHAAKGEWVRLIPIPVIPWGRLSPVFDALRAVDDPFAAANRLSQLRLREQWDLARIFVLTKLSPAELAVVELLSHAGLSQTEAAEKLALSPRTVEQHLRAAYRKAAEHWEVESVNQTQLVRLLSLYFSYKP